MKRPADFDICGSPSRARYSGLLDEFGPELFSVPLRFEEELQVIFS